MKNKKLIVISGPTGVGKTEISLQTAKYLQAPVISSDSRQLYKGLAIGTAAPTAEQMQQVKHYMVGILDITDYYSASEFEQECLRLIDSIDSEYIILSGGSMMYIDAVCKGIDDIPNIDPDLRKNLYDLYEKEGLEPIRSQLKMLDPIFYNQVDLKNYKRVIHALEICLMTGKPYSSLRTNTPKERPFEIIKVGLMRDRDVLYTHINARTDKMISDGLIDEARKYYPYRHLNSLNTVGYKELFKYFDGEYTLDFAIEKIKQNTRIYSRKQMTWFKRDTEIKWLNITQLNTNEAVSKIVSLINS